jgi:hypothetical protein
MAGVKLLREHRPTDEAKLQFQNEIDKMMMHEKTYVNNSSCPAFKFCHPILD